MFNKETEFDSTKFIILLSIICVIFFVIVMKAFEYLPKDAGVLPQDEYNISTANTQPQEEKSKDDNEESSDEDEDSDNYENSNNLNTISSQDNDFDEIDAPPGVNPEIKKTINNDAHISEDKEVTVIKSIINAKKLKNEEKYSDAIKEYQNVLDNTNDKEIMAECYEGMSAIYAINKKNGTALSFALKAYNMSPNSSRALLSAQIYYKTGDTERATKIVNKLLQEEIK